MRVERYRRRRRRRRHRRGVRRRRDRRGVRRRRDRRGVGRRRCVGQRRRGRRPRHGRRRGRARADGVRADGGSRPRRRGCSWGNNERYGNRIDRFVGTIAFLDDTGRPSAVFGRGYYARTTLSAWNYRDGALTNLWTLDERRLQPAAPPSFHIGEGMAPAPKPDIHVRRDTPGGRGPPSTSSPNDSWALKSSVSIRAIPAERSR
ncbi:hypothetical protein WMF30_06055 [Sorangium sp. So ce134]